MKYKNNMLKVLAVLLVTVSFINLFAPCFTVQAKTKGKCTDYDKTFTEQKISYTIESTVSSAKSDKYSAQLCKIDGQYQILYSKNGKKLSKSNAEQKIRKELKLDDDAELNLYYMTQYDGVFYICLQTEKNIDKNGYGSYSLISNPEKFFIAETKDFKSYKAYETYIVDYKSNYLSNRFFPQLYKSKDIFFYIYSVCNDYIYVKENAEGEQSFYIYDPIGYCGESPDKMTERLYFEEELEYDPSEYEDVVGVELMTVVEESKLRVYALLEHNLYFYYDTSENATNNTLYDFEVDIRHSLSWAKVVDEWVLNGIYSCATANFSSYEQFYTVSWNDDKTYSGVTGILGKDEKQSFSFKFKKPVNDQMFDMFGIVVYGGAVCAKKDKSGKLNVKSNLFISLEDGDCYRLDNKGKLKTIELPFTRYIYSGVTCTNTKKGWSAVVSDDCIYLSKDGFLTCRSIYLPSVSNFVDIETYGNYLYVLTRNALYRLPVSL